MRTIVIAILLLVVVIGSWTGLWLYGASEADRQIDAWLAAEAAHGRQWTCPLREMGGYPIALSVSCGRATFAGEALGRRVTASVAGLTATASLAHPRSVAVTLSAPFTYRSSDGATDLRGQWTNLDIDLEGLPNVATVLLAGTNMSIEGLFGPAAHQNLGSARLDARFSLPTGGPDPTLGFDIAVAAATQISQIDAIFGDRQPTSLHFAGQLDRTDVGDVRTPEEAMDRWRRADGHIHLDAATIDRGTSHVTATGLLRLDPAHRPQGHLDARFVGLEPILKRYGINANLAAAGALLNTIFGGGGQIRAPAEPGAIHLPINLQDGHIGVGPIRTNIALPPLY